MEEEINALIGGAILNTEMRGRYLVGFSKIIPDTEVMNLIQVRGEILTTTGVHKHFGENNPGVTGGLNWAAMEWCVKDSRKFGKCFVRDYALE